jgi:hypothetical protein
VVYFGVSHFQTLKEVDASARKPGERRRPLPSPFRRLARLLLRIISKMRVHTDAGPFLEQVSDREFPKYRRSCCTRSTWARYPRRPGC